MTRLGKRERELRRSQWSAYRAVKAAVIADNLAGPRPEKSLLSRDETYGLLLNTHTRGIQVGQRKLVLTEKQFVKKPGK